jgi:uncharacterized membrane protein YagU involved in acid resistance
MTAAVAGQGTVAGVSVASIVRGAVAGLVGGSVFGVQMAVGGMLPMVAGMVGSNSVVVGFVLHMVISAVIGAVYGIIAPRLPDGWLVVVGAGIVYGIIWWVLGALIIMPLALGMGGMVFVIEEMQLMSLVGHIIFGIVMAAFFALIRRD